MDRDGFVFYKSFLTAIEELPDEEQLEVYRAICHYGLHGEEPQESGIAKAMFHLIRPQIDANNRRYESGKQGGRPKAKSGASDNQVVTEAEPSENQTETKSKPSGKQGETTGEPKEKDKVKDKDKDKDKENEKGKVKENDSPHNPPEGEESARDAPAALQERRFEEFWTAYPKKQGKGAARKAWMKIHPDTALHKAIMESVKAHAQYNPQWLKDGGQYIPNPATWLNQSRWEDAKPIATMNTNGGGRNDAGQQDTAAGFRRSTGFRRADTDPDPDS